MPFGALGIGLGVVGLAFIALGGAQQRKGKGTETDPRRNYWGFATAVSGFLLLGVSMVLSRVFISGPGWGYAPYDAQALYLSAVGIGALPFAGFMFVTRRKLGALFMAVGVVLCGTALLFTYTFELRFLDEMRP
jgi:hypothetical protein